MGQQASVEAHEPLPSGLFAAAEPESAVFPILRRLAPEVRAEIDRHHGIDTTIRTELRVDRVAGGVRLRRFYWSMQQNDPASPTRFGARTVYCDRKDPSPRVHVFPTDPVLSFLGDDDGPLGSHVAAARMEVLRYIPLRRLTYRLHDGEGLPATVIAKVKTTGGLNRATTAFRAVEEAVGRGGRKRLRVPTVVGLDERRHVLYLEHLPGESLDVALRQADLVAAMERLGEYHRDLQELDVHAAVPRRATADWLADARQAVDRITLLVPSAARQAEAVYDGLVRRVPGDGRLLYCQGDFLPGQILCHPSGWSVVDLDDSRYADPLSDVAAMYNALPHACRLPSTVSEDARQAYLDAYLRRSGEKLDGDRWGWFLVLLRLYDLGKRLVKGRAAPGEAQLVLEQLTTPGSGGTPA